MVNSPDSKLLRIFVGESDQVEHEPLYERIVYEAKKEGLAGATVLKGVMGYGAGSIIHRSKMVALSVDLPMVIEIVDEEAKIEDFRDTLRVLFEKAGGGGLVTIEKMHVIHYEAGEKRS